jgi:trigger factor
MSAAELESIPLTVNVERSGACRKLLHIEVPATAVSAEFQKVLAGFARMARIPGFRPGKAPIPLVERHFGKEILDETKDRLLPQAYQAALRREKLSPVAVVDVTNVSVLAGTALTFDVSVDVDPEFSLPSYRGIPVQKRKVAVTDAQVESAVQNLRERAARFEESAERQAQKGDIVQVDFAGTVDGRPIQELEGQHAELATGHDFWVLLGDQELIPGLGAGLEGIRTGEHRDVTVTFPADFTAPALAGKTAVYAVDAKAVRERKLPAIDAEFLKQAGAESEEDMRRRIREGMSRTAEQMMAEDMKGQIIGWLLGHVSIGELPRTMVEEEARRIVRDVVMDSTSRGVSKAEIEQRRNDIFDHAARSSEERIRVQYILRRIAEGEALAVSDEEVDRDLDSMARRYGLSREKVREALEKRDALDGVRRNLLANKALDLVLQAATVEEVEAPAAAPAAGTPA